MKSAEIQGDTGGRVKVLPVRHRTGVECIFHKRPVLSFCGNEVEHDEKS